jgi:hypothetical protein
MIYKFVDINSLVIPRSRYSAYVDEHINGKHELFQFFNDTFHFPDFWNASLERTLIFSLMKVSAMKFLHCVRNIRCHFHYLPMMKKRNDMNFYD